MNTLLFSLKYRVVSAKIIGHSWVGEGLERDMNNNIPVYATEIEFDPADQSCLIHLTAPFFTPFFQLSALKLKQYIESLEAIDNTEFLKIKKSNDYMNVKTAADERSLQSIFAAIKPDQINDICANLTEG